MASEVFAVHVKWDSAGLKTLDRYLETHEGRALEKRIDAAMGKAIRPLAGRIRVSEVASGVKRHTGNLLRSIRARKPRKRVGEVAAWTVGPTARHAHLVIQGHQIVTPGGRSLGRRSHAFPFVDPVIEAEARQLQAQLSSDVWASSIKAL